MSPSAASSIQRESPTDATVITHPSIITKVTVVPDICAENSTTTIYKFHTYRKTRKQVLTILGSLKYITKVNGNNVIQNLQKVNQFYKILQNENEI